MSKVYAAVFAEQGDQYLGTPYSEMDCQAFYEKMLAAAGIRKNLPGSNAWFRAMDWVGTPEECKKHFGTIPIGATLFIWREAGAPSKYTDGKGNASHMGVYIGRKDGAIHSSASKGCVAYSAFKGKSIKGGWNRVGLTSLMSYGEKVDQMILATTTDLAPTIPVSAETVTPKSAQVVGGRLNVRAKPAGDIITRLEEGEQVEILADHGEWVEVRYHRQGYVMKKFLREV